MTTRHRLLAFLTIAVGAAAASASAGEQTGVQASSAESSPPPTGTGVPAFAQAQWVAPPADREAGKPLPLFRKEFRIAAQPRRAMLRIVGLGDYDLRVNGVRLAHTGINQPWSQYEKTTYYRDFDITALVRAGDNCFGVMLANSFWNNPNPPQGRYNKDGPQRTAKEPFLLCAEITLEHTDGTVARLGTDATWRTGDGPMVFSHIFAGEDFDARRQHAGWDRPGFDDASWQSVRVAEFQLSVGDEFRRAPALMRQVRASRPSAAGNIMSSRASLHTKLKYPGSPGQAARNLSGAATVCDSAADRTPAWPAGATVAGPFADESRSRWIACSPSVPRSNDGTWACATPLPQRASIRLAVRRMGVS